MVLIGRFANRGAGNGVSRKISSSRDEIRALCGPQKSGFPVEMGQRMLDSGLEVLDSGNVVRVCGNDDFIFLERFSLGSTRL